MSRPCNPAMAEDFRNVHDLAVFGLARDSDRKVVIVAAIVHGTEIPEIDHNLASVHADIGHNVSNAEQFFIEVAVQMGSEAATGIVDYIFVGVERTGSG